MTRPMTNCRVCVRSPTMEWQKSHVGEEKVILFHTWPGLPTTTGHQGQTCKKVRRIRIMACAPVNNEITTSPTSMASLCDDRWYSPWKDQSSPVPLWTLQFRVLLVLLRCALTTSRCYGWIKTSYLWSHVLSDSQPISRITVPNIRIDKLTKTLASLPHAWYICFVYHGVPKTWRAGKTSIKIRSWSKWKHHFIMLFNHASMLKAD